MRGGGKKKKSGKERMGNPIPLPRKKEKSALEALPHLPLFSRRKKPEGRKK